MRRERGWHPVELGRPPCEPVQSRRNDNAVGKHVLAIFRDDPESARRRLNARDPSFIDVWDAVTLKPSTILHEVR